MNGPRSILGLAKRITLVLEEEIAHLRPLQHVIDLVQRAVPPQVGNSFRIAALRARGVEVGEGTVVYGPLEFSGSEAREFAKMTIGRDCIIDVACAFELGEAIDIGDRVTLGHNVMILTTTHELGPKEHRAGALVRSPVSLESGAWIGPRSVILPGVVVGAGAIVDPGSVVNKSVAPNTRVRGTPAKVVEELAP